MSCEPKSSTESERNALKSTYLRWQVAQVLLIRIFRRRYSEEALGAEAFEVPVAAKTSNRSFQRAFRAMSQRFAEPHRSQEHLRR